MKQTNRKSPPPLARLAAILLLALPAGPAMAEQCNASHIGLYQGFPMAGTSAVEGTVGGVIVQFILENCDNFGSFETPREYRIPFCAEFFDTTPCDDSATDCLSNNVAGASGLQGDRWQDAGEFKRCNVMTEAEGFTSALLTPRENGFRDKGENSLYVIMRNPTRHLRIPIRDND